ncbi:MAG: molecular chaperone DnaK [Promethearchaeota archaeon]|nr:MAG: molecular chaperone DnaK [Candidatus Lokiarchaeota archaeon]
MSDTKTKKEKIIGIDLGTSNSAAAIIVAGKPEVIPSAEGVSLGGKAFPSYVAFTKDGTRLIGEPARRQAVSNPDRTIAAIKRKMGENYTVTIDDKKFTPQEISAMILQKIKQDAEAYIGEPVKKAVITVPAYFNDAQRTATKDAGTIAGLEVVRIINEPTAACLAYGLDKSKAKTLKICVLDLGGGTFDVTIMEMGAVDGKGVFEVVSTSGDTKLGGTDMDKIIVDWVVSEFKKKNNVSLREDSTAMARVLDAGEKAKIELSTAYSTRINLPFLSQNEDGPLHLDIEMTRAKLEELIAPVLRRLESPMQRAIDDAGFPPSGVDKVILVGGPTRMPSVRDAFKKFFGKEPERSVDPMECVAIGAAIQGAVMAGEVDELLLLDVTPLTLGIETLGGVRTPLIERNTTIPCERAKVFSTAADNQPAVEINVLQGERPMAADNLTLGRFRLEGIPPAPRGIPQIEVKFEIDENGIVNVTAKDMGTGKEQKITIERNKGTGLSDEEVQKMVDEAKKFESQDKEKQEQVETRNNAESMVYQAEKLMKEHADKLDDDLKNELLRGIDDVKDALKSDDNTRIKSTFETLNESLQKFGTKIYGQQGGPGGPGGPMGGMGGMNPEDFARAAQEAAKSQGAGGATYEDDPKKKKKRKSVDVDWEEEE